MKNLTKPCVNNRRAIWYIPVAKIRYNPAIRLLPHRQDLPPVQSEGVNNTMVTARGTSKESQSVSNPGYGVYTIYTIYDATNCANCKSRAFSTAIVEVPLSQIRSYTRL